VHFDVEVGESLKKNIWFWKCHQSSKGSDSRDMKLHGERGNVRFQIGAFVQECAIGSKHCPEDGPKGTNRLLKSRWELVGEQAVGLQDWADFLP